MSEWFEATPTIISKLRLFANHLLLFMISRKPDCSSMNRNTILLLLFLSCSFQGQSQSTPTIESVTNSLRQAGNTIMGYFPSKINLKEGSTSSVEIEFPNGFHLNAAEDVKAILNYKWADGTPLQLKFGIDAAGNIKADKYHLVKIFGSDWNINWTTEFDSEGLMRSATEYLKSAGDKLYEWWNSSSDSTATKG